MPDPALPGFLGSLAPTLDRYGYLAVVFLVLVENFGVPLPGETIIIAAAIYAGAGHLNIFLVGLLAFVAAVVGDNVGFAIGHFGGRKLVDRYGKYILLTPHRFAKAEDFFIRYGGRVVAVARFIEGLRQANGIIAGTIGMHWRKFLLWNAVGAALWVGTWTTIGYYAGGHITPIYHALSTYVPAVLVALVVVVVAVVVVRKRRARGERAASPPSGPEIEPDVESADA